MSKTRADITGLMVKAKPGWEKRAKALARPEFFFVSIGVRPEIRHGLTARESVRLQGMLQLVREAASYMAAGMVKGAVKYSKDNYSVDTWVAHVVGELTDEMNYVMLMADAYFKNKVDPASQIPTKKSR